MAIFGRDIQAQGFPSGTDYGLISRWSEVDKGDYVVAFCIKGDKPEFLWVIERADGKVLSVEERKPNFDPIFGIDECEYRDWRHKVIGLIDTDIEAKKNEVGQG